METATSWKTEAQILFIKYVPTCSQKFLFQATFSPVSTQILFKPKNKSCYELWVIGEKKDQHKRIQTRNPSMSWLSSVGSANISNQDSAFVLLPTL